MINTDFYWKIKLCDVTITKRMTVFQIRSPTCISYRLNVTHSNISLFFVKGGLDNIFGRKEFSMFKMIYISQTDKENTNIPPKSDKFIKSCLACIKVEWD